MKFIDYVFLLFLIVSSLDPTGFYTSHLKVILFVFLVGYGFLKLMSGSVKITKENQATLFLFVLIPIYGLLVSALSQTNIDENYARGHFQSMMFVFLFVFLVTRDIKEIMKIYWLNGITIAIVTIGLFSYAQVSHDQFLVVYELMGEGDNSNFLMANGREFLGFSIDGLYFRCGPLIIFGLLYNLYFYKGLFRPILTIILLGSLLISGTRTPALVATLIFLIYIKDLTNSSTNSSIKSIAKWLGGGLSFLLIIALFILIYKLATEKGVGSNDLKYANFQSYINDIFTGLHCIFGAGVGSTFWAAGNKEMLAYTELSYMDIFRIYGLFVGSFLIWRLVLPVVSVRPFLKKHLEYKRFFLGYILFLILAGTNPVLIGSIGFAGFTLIMAINNNIKNKKI